MRSSGGGCRWRRRAGVLAVGAFLLVVAVACTGAPQPRPTASGPAPSGPAPSASASAITLDPVRLTVASGTDPGSAAGRSLNLPAGWTGEVWASVPGARVAAWTADGRLLVSTGSGGAIVSLTPVSAGRAPTATALLSGLDGPQGLAFADHGRLLVVGEASRITTWDYADGHVSNRRVLVDGLPTAGHGAKAVAAHGDTVFYSLGSSGNRVPADRAAQPQRATVWRVALDGTGDRIVATGVRNGFGLAIAPDGTLFTAVNQADEQPYPFRDGSGHYGRIVRDYVNENPVDQVSRLTSGTDLGWPYCVPDSRSAMTGLPYVDDVDTNADGGALDCSALPPTMVGLPAHSAPLGLAFTRGTALQQSVGDGALIAVHGSWDRQPPRAPSVMYSPWDAASRSLGEAVPLVTGFQNTDGTRWGRSVDAVAGPDGSLYVTDDQAGLVYRLTPPRG